MARIPIPDQTVSRITSGLIKFISTYGPPQILAQFNLFLVVLFTKNNCTIICVIISSYVFLCYFCSVHVVVCLFWYPCLCIWVDGTLIGLAAFCTYHTVYLRVPKAFEVCARVVLSKFQPWSKCRIY